MSNFVVSEDNTLPHDVPANSISVFYARICAEPDDDFESTGKLYVDISDLNTDDNAKHGPDYSEKNSSQKVAIASRTLIAAYTAWKSPPLLKYKGKLKVKGTVKLSNANLSQVSISGGPPLQGNTTCGMGPGTATVPVNISSASGSAKIESQDAELEISTEGYPDDDNFELELISQSASVVPWCVSPGVDPGQEVDLEASFIQKNDIALCMAFGNSLDHLYVVDIIR